jgi:hypothetical protein
MKTPTKLNSLVSMMIQIEKLTTDCPNDQDLGKKVRAAFEGKTIVPKWSVDEYTEEGHIAVALFESLPHAKMYLDMISEVEKGEKKFCITDLRIYWVKNLSEYKILVDKKTGMYVNFVFENDKVETCNTSYPELWGKYVFPEDIKSYINRKDPVNKIDWDIFFEKTELVKVGLSFSQN